MKFTIMSKNVNSTTKRKKRKCISLDTKYEIIKKHLKEAKTSDLANEYEKSASTISTIMPSQEKIIKEYEDNCLVNERKRIKISKYP